MNLLNFSATQLMRRLEEGEITSLEIVESCIAQIDSKEEEVRAWEHLDYDFARQQAKIVTLFELVALLLDYFMEYQLV